MKNSNKPNRLILRMLAALMFIATSPSILGQEFERGSISSNICDTSIIRSIDSNTSMIYSRHNASVFMLVRNGVNPVRTWFIEPLYVNDFEIIDGIVYFCGYKRENGVKKAIFGGFPLSTFNTSSTFEYSVLDTCTEFIKLDYYLIGLGGGGGIYPNHEDHIVMTGTTGGRADVIADCAVTTSLLPAPGTPSSYYSCNVFFSNKTSECFDDVAVTDNYVVVSSRDSINNFLCIDLLEFTKPLTIGNSIFTSYFTHLRLFNPSADSPIILEKTIDDKCAAVFKDQGYSRMSMLQLTAPNNLSSSIDIYDDEYQTIFPIDLKFNEKQSVYDILARNIDYRDEPDYGFVGMQIYHVTPDELNAQSPMGSGTNYPGRYLWSIDPTIGPYFVASGASGLLPWMFKYRFDQWNVCPEKFGYRYELGTPSCSTEEDLILQYKWYILGIKEGKANVEKEEFPIKCPVERDTMQ